MNGSERDAKTAPGMDAQGKDILSELKDRSIFLGWIAGFIIIGALVWSFTRPLRVRCLMDTVNRTLAAAEDARRLVPFAGTASLPVRPLGVWYGVKDSAERMFIFAVMRDGILVPCGAQVSREGRVVEVIPLGSHSRQVFGRLTPGLIQIYINRIEKSAAEGSRK